MHTANPEQAEAWNGHEGDHWTEHADRYERASARHQRLLLDRCAVASHEHALDIGCGAGRTTREVARLATSGSALGVDLSAQMLDLARMRAKEEGLTNVTHEQADAQVHPFDRGGFDLVLSSFGAMFFADPVAAFTNIGLSLRPGGRLTLLVWRELANNEWLNELRASLAVGRELPTPPPDAPTPFALADQERVSKILGSSGFTDIGFEEIDEPLEFGSDADDAYAFMSTMGIVKGLTHDLDDAGRRAAHEALRATITAHAGSQGVLFGSATWLITARRA